MASQRLLSTPELLRHICAHLDSRELGRFSQTCHRIHEQISPYLWHTIGTDALKALLTVVLYPTRSERRYEWNKTLAARLERFELYARHVQVIHFWPKPDQDYVDPVFDSMAEIPDALIVKRDTHAIISKLSKLSAMREGPPFKNLHILTWQATTPESFDAMTTLLSHSLQELQLFIIGDHNKIMTDGEISAWRTSIESVCDSIAIRAPRIQRLGATATFMNARAYETRLSELLLELPDLQTLGLGMLPGRNSPVWRAVSQHTELDALTLSLENLALDQEITLPDSRKNSCPNILGMDITWADALTVSSVLSILPSLRDVALWVNTNEELDRDGVVKMLQTISTLRKLESLSISVTDYMDRIADNVEEQESFHVAESDPFDCMVLEVLSRCNRIKDFMLHLTLHCMRVTLPAVLFKRLGRRWPALERFCIQVDPHPAGSPSSPPAVSLKTLHRLARRCPKLSSVTVPRLCALHIPKHPGFIIPQPMRLAFGEDSPLVQPASVASYLVQGWKKIELTPMGSASNEWASVSSFIENRSTYDIIKDSWMAAS